MLGTVALEILISAILSIVAILIAVGLSILLTKFMEFLEGIFGDNLNVIISFVILWVGITAIIYIYLHIN